MTKVSDYTLDEIDSIAKDLIQTLCDEAAPQDLGVIALCRAIVMIGEQQDLDMACRYIDELSDVPFDTADLEEDMEETE